jgi:HK97 family phage prohead protease
VKTKAQLSYAQKLDAEAVDTYRVLFSTYGVRDSYGDVMQPGAFAGADAENVLYLWSHSMGEPPPGKVLALEEVGRDGLPNVIQERYPEASGGMWAHVRLFDTQRGQELKAAFDGGAPLRASFGYYELDGTDVLKGGVSTHYVSAVELIEISPVNLPANPATYAGKAGARHSASDQERIEQIAQHALALGAVSVVLAEAKAGAEETREAAEDESYVEKDGASGTDTLHSKYSFFMLATC